MDCAVLGIFDYFFFVQQSNEPSRLNVAYLPKYMFVLVDASKNDRRQLKSLVADHVGRDGK
jgi:hypothetical protein